MLMSRTVTTLAIAAAAATALAVGTASPAGAVKGDLDGTSHPYAGVLLTYGTDGAPHQGCSGVLVSPTVFVTAAHCAERFTADVPHAPRFVTFDPSWSTADPSDAPDRVYPVAFGVVPPGWSTVARSDDVVGDVGLAVLAEPVTDVVPAALPRQGLLDALRESGSLTGGAATVVGYGDQGIATGPGGPVEVTSAPLVQRRSAVQRIQAATPTHLVLTTVQQLGYGGNCFGDSGSPHLLGDTVVAVSSLIDAQCNALSSAPRMDTPAVRAFLSSYVTVP